MLNITNREFTPSIWNKMVIEAADSRQFDKEHKNICRVIYPNSTCKLELKTDREVKNFLKEHGTWAAACGKMPLSEVLNITRICALNNPINPETIDPIKNSLDIFEIRAEIKYNDGFIGVLRKVMAVFFNLFTTDSVNLFSMDRTNVDLEVKDFSNSYLLPWIIGNDADFARWINITSFS